MPVRCYGIKKIITNGNVMYVRIHVSDFKFCILHIQRFFCPMHAYTIESLGSNDYLNKEYGITLSLYKI